MNPAAPAWRRDLALAAAGLLALLAWDRSGADLWLSGLYGDGAGFALRDAWLTATLAHDGGRRLSMLALAALAWDAWRPWAPGPSPRERRAALLLTAALLLLVPLLKRASSTSCPWDLALYGGGWPYVPHQWLGVHDGGPGHCFPSGHAVAAFAFVAPFFVWRRHRPRVARALLASAVLAGAAFGWAQLARGAHFASHTLWSAWLCWTAAAMAMPWVAPPAARVSCP